MEENLHIIEQKHNKKAVLLVIRINEKIIHVKEEKIFHILKLKLLHYNLLK